MRAQKPGPDHPNAPTAKDNPTRCTGCDGNGCKFCGGSGLVPAWIYEN